MTRRKFGEIQRLPSGKYRARYSHNGGRYSAGRAFFSRDDAAAWLRSEEKLIEFGQWAPPETRARRAAASGLTVGGWIERWLEIRAHGQGALQPSSLQTYRAIFNNRILEVGGMAGRLRDTPLAELTRRDVAEWWDAINLAFDTPARNQHAYRYLKTAISAAVDRDLIDSNPVALKAGRTKPKPKRKQMPSTKALLAVIDQLSPGTPRVNPRYKLLAILTLMHGVRIGEALALRRKDVIKVGDGYSVRVAGTAYRSTENGHTVMRRKDTPKTQAAYREVPIFPRFTDDVAWHLSHCVGNAPDALVFQAAGGGIIMDTTARSVFERAKIRAGHKGLALSPHYGRVWLITTLAEQGMTIPAIGELLGQRDLKTITEIYMRSTAEKNRGVLDAVNDLL